MCARQRAPPSAAESLASPSNRPNNAPCVPQNRTRPARATHNNNNEQVGINATRSAVFLLFNLALGAYILGTLPLLVVKADERTGRCVVARARRFVVVVARAP